MNINMWMINFEIQSLISP